MWQLRLRSISQLPAVFSLGYRALLPTSKKRNRWGSLRWSPFGRLPHEGWRWHPSLGCSKTIPSCEVVNFFSGFFSRRAFLWRSGGLGTLISGIHPGQHFSIVNGKLSKFIQIPIDTKHQMFINLSFVCPVRRSYGHPVQFIRFGSECQSNLRKLEKEFVWIHFQVHPRI